MNDTSTNATFTSFKDVYRVNIQNGKNLPIDLLPKVPAAGGPLLSTYCPSRMGEHAKSKSTGGFYCC